MGKITLNNEDLMSKMYLYDYIFRELDQGLASSRQRMTIETPTVRQETIVRNFNPFQGISSLLGAKNKKNDFFRRTFFKNKN